MRGEWGREGKVKDSILTCYSKVFMIKNLDFQLEIKNKTLLLTG